MSLPQDNSGGAKPGSVAPGSVAPDSAELRALVELSRRTEPFGRAELDAGLDAVTARLTATHARHKQLRRVVPLVLFAVLSVGVVISRLWPTHEPIALKYAVEGGVVLDGGYLREVDGAGVRLVFEEGTRFSLSSGARARLRSVSSLGARLGLESGAAAFSVTPNLQHHWEVEVGPFLVQVKGTAFDVAWDPRAEQFQLDLKHGVVVVTGPVSGGELTLNAGQHLAVDLGRGETRITEPRITEPRITEPRITERRAEHTPVSAASTTAAVRNQESVAPAQATAAGMQAEARTPSVAKRDWVSYMAQGQWDKILEQAEQVGIPTVHATASAEDLFTLGNAARYRHRTQLARESLLTLQRRFAQSARAVDALFLLGRLDESRGDSSGARVWFDKYLERSPNGAYAAEALGRKMTLIARSLGSDAARPVAEEYVRRFPKGSYARAARAMLKPH